MPNFQRPELAYRILEIIKDGKKFSPEISAIITREKESEWQKEKKGKFKGITKEEWEERIKKAIQVRLRLLKAEKLIKSEIKAFKLSCKRDFRSHLLRKIDGVVQENKTSKQRTMNSYELTSDGKSYL